jgi:hypothetical protein
MMFLVRDHSLGLFFWWKHKCYVICNINSNGESVIKKIRKTHFGTAFWHKQQSFFHRLKSLKFRGRRPIIKMYPLPAPFLVEGEAPFHWIKISIFPNFALQRNVCPKLMHEGYLNSCYIRMGVELIWRGAKSVLKFHWFYLKIRQGHIISPSILCKA